jgi:hypothetical protein
MPMPYSSTTVPASADEVWALVRDFNGLPAWHPAISESSLQSGADASSVGAVRKLTLGDGGVVVERLVTLDDTDRRYTYEILESPFPVRRYLSTIRVAPVTVDGHAFVEWWSLSTTFADGVYGTGLAALRERFSK